MNGISLHLAPHAPWILLALATVAFAALARWGYRFAAPPLPAAARRLLPVLRFLAVLLLVWLLAQPVFEHSRAAGARVVILVDRSSSMELEATPGGERRSVVAERAVRTLERLLRGRATVEVASFASALEPDTAGRGASVPGSRGATALGDALGQLGSTPAGQRATAIAVVSDGAVNAGADPVAAARALAIPVSTVPVGERVGLDRVVTSIEASADGRVGQREPVRVHVVSSEPKGTAIPVRLMDQGTEIARGTAIAPGNGAEAVVQLEATPRQSGLAVWTAEIDSARGELTTANNARSVGLEIAPGRIHALIVSAGLNWDLTFVRRALIGDSSLAVVTWTRESGRWRALGSSGMPLARGPGSREAGSTPSSMDLPSPSDLRAQAVVVLDGVAASEVSPAFDRALSGFVRDGGGLLVLGGASPGLMRYRSGTLGADLGVRLTADVVARAAVPAPTAEAGDLAAWDDDPVRGQQAWRDAAPLTDLIPLAPGSGDRVLIASSGPAESGPPLIVARRIGRGQAVLVNGTGVWRWSLSPTDDLAGERGRKFWRHLVRWLAEPVQGEPLRVRPERWVAASGDPVRLFATLQDTAFRPVAGAAIEGELTRSGRAARPLRFEPRESGAYAATLEGLEPGRYRVTIHARTGAGGRELGHATTEFAVDRWSLEEARSDPDTATLAAVARESGGLSIPVRELGSGGGLMVQRALAHLGAGRKETVRLWESPWIFAIVVGALSCEWAWRRRRGLP
ncbi:MAG TPA: hypothetical protein VL123_02935 [Candidatus Udaeobacter sp.]|nr:hypothetical protein [Candidatus Udaeobacter sp.]